MGCQNRNAACGMINRSTIGIYACYIELNARDAISKPRKVAPFANGELKRKISHLYKRPAWGPMAHRMRVGPRPRVNARQPSFCHVLEKALSVEEYFCPSAFVKASVCIRDLIMSIG